MRTQIAATTIPREETTAPPPGCTTKNRAGLLRQNAVSSPACSEKSLQFCGVKPESSIGPTIGQADPTPAPQPTTNAQDSRRLPPRIHYSRFLSLKFWLGDLDSNQDSQIQSLESYRLDDLPAGRECCSQRRTASLCNT